ncbi:Ig-like domain-containing protein [Colwellia asteriadis]|uniref:Ig-like domain-containing protein n=1 Tax=Colwellia asteriadis TaxID=517723 RepID=A0ABN1L2J5_9GAMM
MRKLGFIFISLYLSLLIGCNGHTDNGDSQTPQTVATISLSITDSEGNTKVSFDKNETVTLIATVLDDKQQSIANKAVAFSSSLGTLTVDSKLTNSEGIALVTLTNDELTLGAGSATATIGEISSDSFDFEFIDNSSPVELPTIATKILLNGELANQFKTDQEVQVLSTLLDSNGQGIENKLINFTADIGQLSAQSALTNAQGIASVYLKSDTDIIGAGVMTSAYDLTNNEDENSTISSTVNYQILSAGAIINSNVRIGHFNDAGSFVEGEIALSVANNSISAGGTLGLRVDLVDDNNALISTPIPVSFSSNCVQNENAIIDESILSINGSATATFEDTSCAGKNGTDDVLIASITINGVTTTASKVISIQGEQIGSIEFISAEPTSIVLKGTGGQNQQETSTLTYRVKSQLNNVLAQQEVNFTLSTTVGGITLSRHSGVTNSQGLITTQVSAGTVPTAVRVTASAAMDLNGETITVQSQSDLLSINTGLPEQRSMSIAASVLNPEAHNVFGEESIITVWLSDNFNNPAPDGTTVNFTAEGGQIAPTCSTVNGSCSVAWQSAEPRVADHRITILATALGHESFFDTNGNNTFDDNDGSAIIDVAGINDFTIDSGLDNYPAQSSGFIDMSEAWRDDNENSIYDSGEIFIDFNNDNQFNSADGLFNGPQCTGTKCANTQAKTIHTRKAIRLVMASSAAEYRLSNSDYSTIYNDSITNDVADIPAIADGSTQAFNFDFADTGTPNQIMPAGTTVAIELSAGTLSGQTSYLVGNSNRAGFSNMSFSITNPVEDSSTSAVLIITITSPKGFVTSLTRTIFM